MTRRRRFSEPFSLFAFQDVMAAVIGILFFVVLMMSFDMVNREEAVGAAVSLQSEVNVLTDNQKRLKELIQETDADIRRLATVISMTTTDENALLQKVKAYEQTLRSLQDQVVTNRRTASDLADGSAADKQKNVCLSRECERLQQELSRLAQSLREAKARPRLAYIIDRRNDTKKPWLIEVTATKYRVSQADNIGGQLVFRAESLAERDRLLLEWASRQDRGRSYFCILCKPSGASQAINLEQKLQNLGFELGRDLIPENWDVIQISTGG